MPLDAIVRIPVADMINRDAGESVEQRQPDADKTDVAVKKGVPLAPVHSGLQAGDLRTETTQADDGLAFCHAGRVERLTLL